MRSFLRPAVALLLAMLWLPLSAQDDEETRARNQLARLKQDMAALSEELKSDLARRSSLRDALRTSELAISSIRREIKSTRASLAKNRDQLDRLRRQRQKLLIARGEQQELISEEIQTAYQMGKQAQLRVLLNQEDPATLARAMTYYDYFYQARVDQIQRYLQTVERIDALEPEIRTARDALEANQRTLDIQQEQLVATQRQRERDLKQLNSTIATKDQRLQKMAQDQEELQRLLEVIEQAVADLEVPQEYQPFDSARGQMPWPVEGRASNRFGGRRGQGGMRWQGLNIPAEEGSTVQAIHHGRVVFADWFRGSGLLLIIDHGDGYMSLYAHNEALLRDVGEWVSAGAAVSTVGNSGGRDEAALYFEIRQTGKPVNPVSWLR